MLDKSSITEISNASQVPSQSSTPLSLDLTAS